MKIHHRIRITVQLLLKGMGVWTPMTISTTRFRYNSPSFCIQCQFENMDKTIFKSGSCHAYVIIVAMIGKGIFYGPITPS